VAVLCYMLYAMLCYILAIIATIRAVTTILSCLGITQFAHSAFISAFMRLFIGYKTEILRWGLLGLWAGLGGVLSSCVFFIQLDLPGIASTSFVLHVMYN
jgi:hypothetical protein